MDTEEILHIALAFDENFLIPCYVLLTSLFQNNSRLRMHFHVIASGVPAMERENLRKYIEEHNGGVSFYSLTPESLNGLVLPRDKHYTVETYFRLFFPQLVPPHVKRLLYLDTDMIVNGSIEELYSTEMDHYPAAAVAEVNATENRPDLGIDEKGTYFNAGVLLMNLPEWRKQQISEKALQFIYDFPQKIVFVDQDALNVVLKNNYLPLEGKYNVVFHDVPRNLSNRAYRWFARDKVIIHYTNADKPWNALGQNPLRFLYFDYLKQSPKNASKRYVGFQPTPRNVLKVLKLKAKASICNFHALVLLLKRLGLVDKSPVLK